MLLKRWTNRKRDIFIGRQFWRMWKLYEAQPRWTFRRPILRDLNISNHIFWKWFKRSLHFCKLTLCSSLLSNWGIQVTFTFLRFRFVFKIPWTHVHKNFCHLNQLPRGISCVFLKIKWIFTMLLLVGSVTTRSSVSFASPRRATV